MHIDFDYLRFKNIFSYGNQLTEIKFANGLHLLNGKNGNGKSSVIEALFFCLYGQPYRKININKLVNWKNKSKLYTECSFRIDGHVYLIVRTLLPNKVTISKDGQELDLLSSKRLVQEEINRILGIEPQLFRQVICLAVSYNKPFLSLTAIEKRDIAESIFNIKVFGDMLKTLRKSSSGLKIQSEINKKTLALMESNLLTIKGQIKNLRSANTDFEINKEKDLEETTAKINSLTFDIRNCQLQIDSLELQNKNSLESPLMVIDHNFIVDTLKKTLTLVEYRVSETKKHIDFIENNDVCNMCNSLLTDEHREKERKSLQIRLLELDMETRTGKQHLEDAQRTLSERRKIEKSISDNSNKILNLKDKQRLFAKEVAHQQEKLQSIKDRTINLNIQKLDSEFDKKKEEYSKLYTVNQELSSKIKNHNIISDILSDTGIKTFFLRKMMPILNGKINEYLNRFELPISVSFNESMEEVIKVPGQTDDVSYFSFSEGEKKRIDIAILFSFIEITKIVCNWNCNVLIMDEIMDSATDSDGLDKIFYTIKNMTRSDIGLSIYMISHRMDDNYRQLFNTIINAEKVNGFSKLILEVS